MWLTSTSVEADRVDDTTTTTTIAPPDQRTPTDTIPKGPDVPDGPTVIPPDADWSPPTDREVATAVELVLADRTVTESRRGFGLSTDPDDITKAVQETMRRRTPDNPLGIALSEEELKAAHVWNDYVAALGALDGLFERNSSVTARYRSNRDIDDPSFEVLLTDQASPSLRKEIEATVGPGVPYSITEVVFSTDEITALAELAESAVELREGSELEKSLDQLGLTPQLVVFSDSDQFVEIGVDASPGRRSDEALSDQLQSILNATAGDLGLPQRERSAPAGSVFRISQTGPETKPLASRTDAVGSPKAGLRVSTPDGNCTSANSLISNFKIYNMTAGHCFGNGNGGISHQNVSWGTSGTGQHKDTEGNTTNTWALDYAIAEAPSRGMSSQYVMEVSDTTGLASYYPMIDTNYNTETTSTVVCYGGASSNRPLIYSSIPHRTVCGWVLGRSGGGRIEVSINVCLGDSGALVYTGYKAYGIVSRSNTTIAGTSGLCASRMSYARMAAQYADIGGSAATMTLSFGTLAFRHSSQCVDAFYGGTASPTKVTQYPCHGGQAQLWKLVPVNGGDADVYYIRRNAGPYCLTASATTNAYGPIVNQTNCTNASTQKFRLERVSGQYFRMRSISRNACVDIPETSNEAGKELISYSCTTNTNQQVRL